MDDKSTMRPTHMAILNLNNQVKENRTMVFGAMLMVLAFSAATFGLTLGAAEFSKETKTGTKELLTVAGTKEVVRAAAAPKKLKDVSTGTSMMNLVGMDTLVTSTAGTGGNKFRVEKVTAAEVDMNESVLTINTASGETYTIDETGAHHDGKQASVRYPADFTNTEDVAFKPSPGHISNHGVSDTAVAAEGAIESDGTDKCSGSYFWASFAVSGGRGCRSDGKCKVWTSLPCTRCDTVSNECGLGWFDNSCPLGFKCKAYSYDNFMCLHGSPCKQWRNYGRCSRHKCVKESPTDRVGGYCWWGGSCGWAYHNGKPTQLECFTNCGTEAFGLLDDGEGRCGIPGVTDPNAFCNTGSGR